MARRSDSDAGVSTLAVDLNADLGEGRELLPGRPASGAAGGPAGDQTTDDGLLRLVTTAHVACGFHAGGPSVMRRTVAAAAAAGVEVGAHPSYPDAEGFGRQAMDHPAERVVDDVLYQVGALMGVAGACGVTVRSVKPHGALYHRMATDPQCAAAVASAVLRLGEDLSLVVPAGSAAIAVAEAAGLRVVCEAFCDRGYRSDGSLAPRGEPGSLLTDPNEAAGRALSLVTTGEVQTVEGTVIQLRCDTLCVHGDTPGAVAVAGSVRQALE
ncbi:MAG TPA: 5-oxoprolinase subunit PxpA, partial [Acidimicrobiales bacterium]|nr:5-oxoprolinase subunit PxpA [Acidimicrobiales bacterium]